MKDILRINILMDFYGNLLTANQIKILDLYASNDYSLTEIAEIAKISRQGVFDNIKRAIKQLEEYEAKLNLYAKFVKNKQIVFQIDNDIKANKFDNIINLVNKIVEG